MRTFLLFALLLLGVSVAFGTQPPPGPIPVPCDPCDIDVCDPCSVPGPCTVIYGCDTCGDYTVQIKVTCLIGADIKTAPKGTVVTVKFDGRAVEDLGVDNDGIVTIKNVPGGTGFYYYAKYKDGNGMRYGFPLISGTTPNADKTYEGLMTLGK